MYNKNFKILAFHSHYNANLRSISETVIMHLKDVTPVIQCDHIGNSNTSESDTGNDDSGSDGGSVNNSAFVKSDTVMVQLEDETLVHNMLPDVCELDCTTTEVVEDRANNTPSKEHGSQRAAGNPIERRDSTVPESRLLMDDTTPVTEENATHPIDVPRNRKKLQRRTGKQVTRG
jgi:hypothetical protein